VPYPRPMPRDTLRSITHPDRLPVIAPSILSADFADMGAECRTVLRDDLGGTAGPGGGDWLHLDVMDGHFVPNLTMGPDLCRALRRALPDVPLDVHLMIQDPQDFVTPFAQAGADVYCFHLEPTLGVYRSKGRPEGPPRYDAVELAERVREAGMAPGLAINPDVPLDRALEAVPHFDLILVMSIFPGFSGQSFKPETLEITRAIRAELRDDQRLEMDGGINPANAPSVREAGCDVLVAASAIFGRPPAERPSVISALRGGKDLT